MDVSPGDISRVIRLVQDVCDRWDDPRVWREYLLHGACALIGGQSGTMVAFHAGGQKGFFGRFAPVAVVGLPESTRQQLVQFTSQWQGRTYAEAGDVNPGFKVIRDELIRQRWCTATRAQISEKVARSAGVRRRRTPATSPAPSTPRTLSSPSATWTFPRASNRSTFIARGGPNPSARARSR